MALSEKLMILITGDASGAIGEMKKLAGEAEKNLGKAGNDVGKFSATATKVGAGMVAVGTGLLATAISAASTTTDLGREVSKLQRYTGLNAESASKLAYASKMSGVAVEDLAVGIGKLSKTMANSPDKLTKFGVEAKTADGKLRSMTDVLGEVSDKFKKMGPGTESTAAALDLFGKSGANLLPFLLKGKDGIQELSDEADKMGLVLSQDNVDAVKKNIVAQRELSAAVQGAKVQIGNEMLPILTKFTELMTGLPGPVKDAIGPIVVIGGAVLVTGGAFLLAAGQIQKAKASFANMSGAAQTGVGVLGGVAAAATVAFTAYSVMSGEIDKAREAQDKLNEGVAASSASGGFGSLRTQITKTAADLAVLEEKSSMWNTFTRSDPWNILKEAGEVDSLDKLRDQLGMISASSIYLSDTLGITQEAATVWLGKMAESGTVFPTVQAALAAYTGKVDENKVGTEEAATAQEGYATAIKHAADVLRGTTDPIFAVMTAQDSLAEAQANSDKIAKDGTKTDAEKEQALRKLWQASWDLTDAQTKLGGAMATGEVSGPKLQAALDTLRLNSIDPTTEAGKALAEKILGVDATAATVSALLKGRVLRVETDQAGLDAFIRALANAQAVIDWMYRNDPGTRGNGLGVFKKSGEAASGGYLPAGRPTLVGELGPELFIPSSSGTVMTSLSTSHALSGGGGAGVTIQNLTVALPNVTNGDELVDELQRYIRRNGPLPLAVA
jgi:hypothetical protein